MDKTVWHYHFIILIIEPPNLLLHKDFYLGNKHTYNWPPKCLKKSLFLLKKTPSFTHLKLRLFVIPVFFGVLFLVVLNLKNSYTAKELKHHKLYFVILFRNFCFYNYCVIGYQELVSQSNNLYFSIESTCTNIY